MWRMRPLLLLAMIASALPDAAVAESPLPPCPTSRKAVWTDCWGVYTYDDWSKYDGEFKDDKKHGQGTIVYADGQKYVGGFRADLRDGEGVYTSPNGVKWVGSFKNDKPNGKGVLYDKEGKVLKSGAWVDGVYKGE